MPHLTFASVHTTARGASFARIVDIRAHTVGPCHSSDTMMHVWQTR